MWAAIDKAAGRSFEPQRITSHSPRLPSHVSKREQMCPGEYALCPALDHTTHVRPIQKRV
jgi:hypothetical protein